MYNMDVSRSVVVSNLPLEFDGKPVLELFDRDNVILAHAKLPGKLVIEFDSAEKAESSLIFSGLDVEIGGESYCIDVDEATPEDIAAVGGNAPQPPADSFDLTGGEVKSDEISRMLVVDTPPTSAGPKGGLELVTMLGGPSRVQQSFKSSRGWALVFTSEEEAERAKLFEGVDFHGSSLSLKSFGRDDASDFGIKVSDDEWVRVESKEDELAEKEKLAEIERQRKKEEEEREAKRKAEELREAQKKAEEAERARLKKEQEEKERAAARERELAKEQADRKARLEREEFARKQEAAKRAEEERLAKERELNAKMEPEVRQTSDIIEKTEEKPQENIESSTEQPLPEAQVEEQSSKLVDPVAEVDKPSSKEASPEAESKFEGDSLKQRFSNLEDRIKKRPPQPTLTTSQIEQTPSKPSGTTLPFSTDLVARVKEWCTIKDKMDGIEKGFIVFLVLIYLRACWVAFH